MTPLQRAFFVVVCCIAPSPAMATPQDVVALALDLPQRSGVEVAAIAEAHLAKPLERKYEGSWWHLTFYRWCELDPEGAEDFVAAHRGTKHLDPFLQGAKKACGIGPDTGGAEGREFEDDIAQVLAEEATGDDRTRALESLLSPRMRTDPVGTLGEIERLGLEGAEKRSLYDAFLKGLGSVPPETVAKILHRLPPGEARTRVAGVAASQWARDEPNAALAWARGLPPGPERSFVLGGVASGQSESDPLAILDILDREGWKVDFRRSGLDQKTFEPGVLDPDERTGGSGMPSVSHVLQIAVTTLFEQGRSGEALERIAQISDARIQDSILHQTLSDWARESPREAVAWILEGEGAISAAHPLATGIKAIAEGGDRDEALALLHQVTDRNTRTNVLSGLSDNAALAEGLVAWIKTFPPEERNYGLHTMVQSRSNEDPAGAAALLVDLPPEIGTSGNWARIAQKWVDLDTAAAAEFFRENTANLPGEAVGRFANSWLRSSPETASKWVLELPGGSGRDAAIGSVVDHLASNQDMEAAVLWAEEIVEPDARDRALQKISASLKPPQNPR